MEHNTDKGREVSELTVSEISRLALENGLTPSEYWTRYVEPELGQNS